MPEPARTWALSLAPWTAEQRALLRAKAADLKSKKLLTLYAIRVDARCSPPHACKLEALVTLKSPQRGSWLEQHVMAGDWRPATGATSNAERSELFAQYDEGDGGTEQGRRTDVPLAVPAPLAIMQARDSPFHPFPTHVT